jgi:beta-galactosidase GanA
MLSKRHKLSRNVFIPVLSIALLSTLIARTQTPDNQIPHLRKHGNATQLIVDGKPFLILGGELGNSSSSSLEYMRPIWPKLVSLNLNTVLMPIYWELIEPTEEKYDFNLVDGLIQEARKHQMHIVPLWFGSWKNSMSTYPPAYVKTDQKRFPRSQDKNGNGIEILSTFSKDNMETDARAFGAFMRHLRELDSTEHTVVMVQVENEIGMIPDSRDRSDVANRLFAQPVPAELMQYLSHNKPNLASELSTMWAANGYKTAGNWEEIFGRGPATDEIFMAWYFARYTNRVVEAGKAEYPLPMYVNAALIRPGHQPGQYPSAGPLPHLMDIWRAGAPKIDFLSPDIYFPNVAEWCEKYHRSGNPLFIPEIQLGQLSAVNALYAVGKHDAIGFSPFSIESAEEPVRGSLTNGYDILTQLAPLILDSQGKGKMAGLLPAGAEQRAPEQIRLGGYILSVTYERPAAPTGQQQSDVPSGGLAIAAGPDEFIFAGTGLVITFEPDSPGDSNVGILTAEEGKYVNNQWVSGRRLNGDQTHQGRHIRLPLGKMGIQRVKLYRYR